METLITRYAYPNPNNRFDYSHLLLGSRVPTIEECCEQTEVLPNTHAEQLVYRSWHHFYGNYIDVRTEYETYYCDEYEDIQSLLIEKYGCPPELISRLESVILDSKSIGLSVSLRYHEDANIYNFMTLESGIDGDLDPCLFQKIVGLELKRIQNEDTV